MSDLDVKEVADGRTNTYQARMLANWLLNGPYDINRIGHNDTDGWYDSEVNHDPERCLLCKLIAVRSSIAERFPSFV